MKRYIAVATIAVLAMLATWAFARRPALNAPVAVTSEFAGVAGSPESDSVRIEQRLIRAEARASAPSSNTRPVSVAKRMPTRKAGFLTRARRVFFGEGRHKPAPFPTVQ